MSEWLETDGLGGFAMGTASGMRTRRYHGWLTAATTPPSGRRLLVNGVEAWLESPSGRCALSSQVYAPDVVHPDGHARIEHFESEPWPRWSYRLENGACIEHELFVLSGSPLVAASWKLIGEHPGARLSVRPLLSGRDPHALHRENPHFCFEAQVGESGTSRTLHWTPYDGIPAVVACTNGQYEHRPEWYRNFLYREERERGFDATEDLASPGVLHFDLTRGEAVLIFEARTPQSPLPERSAEPWIAELRSAERERRARFPSRLERSADAYIVRRGAGKTIIAGYPWFGDWGRDTFIALRGLCLATGRLEDARAILLEWSGFVSDGMLPNRFPDDGDALEYHSVDAPLWYVVAVHAFLQAATRAGVVVTASERKRLIAAVTAILQGYARGTRFGIVLADDGLLAAGQEGVQLTWMDAKVGDHVITPRIGKPVEIEALWLNALTIGAELTGEWKGELAHGQRSFQQRFWNEERGHLFDVVDEGHVPGANDASLRPNQIFAVGGLPFTFLPGERARRVVDAVEAKLWTPLGLRTLDRDDPRYAARYAGGPAERDGVYHQGTVWPWLLGAFVEAWVRVRGNSAAAKSAARARFLAPLEEHLEEAGLGHISEIADGDAPHTPRGAPFQAWSVAEALRIAHCVLADETGSESGNDLVAGTSRASPK